jgi:hypothetical protein
VTDKMLLGLIKHFYPDIIIEDDKYLIHVGCRSSIWNKRGEIEEFVKKYKKNDSKATATLLRDWDRMVTFYRS